MGLTAMENSPGWEESLRRMNNAGHEQHIGRDAWLGESHLDGLGLGEGGQITNAVSNGVSQILATVAQAKQNKLATRGQRSPMQPMAPGGGGEGGGGDMNKWLLIGGGLLLLAVLVFMFSKKKKD